MATHLRRFVTSPLPIFEFEFASESRAPPPLVAAAKCLAHCIRLAPGDDLIMSNMYSLLNYIAAASKDIYNSSNSQANGDAFYDSLDYTTNQLLESGLRGLSEDEKRLVGISTISVVTRLALEFDTEEVTRLTTSMLLQRLRSAEPTVEAAIAYNLVDLALSAPESAFIDIIRVFSAINRSANPDDPRFSNNMVLAAQTRLAQELHRRPELYEIYLVELLTLFADKGVAIQNLKISNPHVKTDDMIEQLASLLLPIDALLAHQDFNPHLAASSGVVSLFRNMWFLCVLFGFPCDSREKEETAMDWLKPALSHIAAKTPSTVLEDSHDTVASDVEYNSVIRQDYAHTVASKHRTALTTHISLRAGDIRSLSSGQTIFVLTMHNMESMRSAAGLTSSLVNYFTNDSINKHPALSACMESVAEKVIRGCINDLNSQASQQMLPVGLSSELRSLLIYSTHRIEKARDIASKYLNRLISSFPSLMCDPPLVCAILEVLTLLRQSCENEFTDEWKTDGAKSLANQIAIKSYFAGEAAGVRLACHQAPDKLDKLPPQSAPSAEIQALKTKMSRTTEEVRNKSTTLTVHDLKRLLFRCAATLLSMEKCEHDLLHYLVALPFAVATPSALAASIEVWTWVISEKPNMEVALMTEVLSAWTDTIRQERGMFSTLLNYDDPFYHAISYSPTDKEVIDKGTKNARRMLTPHALVLQMLLSRLQAARYRRPEMMFLVQHLVLRSARAYRSLSTHALAREARFSLLLFGFETLKSSHLDPYSESLLRESLYSVAFSWFSVRPQWSYGANRVQVDADVKVLAEFLSCLQTDVIRGTSEISSLSPSQLPSRNNHYFNRLRSINLPLRLLTENEMFRLAVWANPTNDPKRGSDQIGTVGATMLEASWAGVLRTVWQIDPAIAVHFPERFKAPSIRNEVIKMVRSSPLEVIDIPEALPIFVGDRLNPDVHRDLKHLLLWAPVPPVIANTFFEPRYNNDPLVLQYAHRVLEQHPVDLTFFFVPQVVQALRYDQLGTIFISQLFCHQIIWNMKANCYKDDLAEIEDPMKPALDLMTQRVVDSLSGDAREFYNREFHFFNEVTSISGKLKPFIKRTKPEKKAKIDEEMAKITVDVGVYLPSNPDGKVVDIDKKSGRPLQSHAKAPFMATFKVRKERVVVNMDPDSVLDVDGQRTEIRTEYDIWQQAIFKVGDDCRQDVLALQVIAMFKNIFTSVGLTLYLFPYRVTATAPGCGVIDVVPNATSRDEMGRAKVNDLLDFFVAKYGGQDTVAFQQARLNFIQSMAAYSVACYILQIKDRHNGNIMIDGEGHIVHIGRRVYDQGSFKLNHEMVVLMGGRHSQGYQLFQNLTVKAFLAIRPHAEQLISTVQLMLDTGLPSFKGEPTMKRLRDRFALGLNERQAAEWMMGIVRNAHENVRSTAYDEFQRLQNDLFSRSLSTASKALKSPTIDDSTQDLIRSSLNDLTSLNSRITGLSLFSPNETLEDISTTDLIYLLVPYVLSEVRGRIRTTERDERISVLKQTQQDLLRFVSYLENFEIVPEEERELHERKPSAIADYAKRRELKIKQYQKEKDLRARIEAVRKRRGQISLFDDTPTDFELILSLLPSKSTYKSKSIDDDDEPDSDTDDILREATLLLIRLCYAQSHSQLESQDQELQLLLSAPPSPPRRPRQETDDRRDKSRQSDADMWKLDAPRSSLGLDGKGPLLDSSGKVTFLVVFAVVYELLTRMQPLRPFTILPSDAADRARIQAQVFGPGHRLPTMSIDEYLEIERERGNIITGGGPASEAAPTSSEQLALEAEMDGTRDGEEKEEAKRQKDEKWARYTDDNPKGAGNTMNRG
ncbi:hypothetical protein DXG03_005711 [Asterophora parasitica]|uniref:1-phosphatidylinositol 4-kinase n=1 Tax=Asterophora parasitica TaxID=117018 RepID=A0A9P7GBA5_9AGAR|nr:hypothetical protein DXG03_005711 [Asterophora parasitica]